MQICKAFFILVQDLHFKVVATLRAFPDFFHNTRSAVLTSLLYITAAKKVGERIAKVSERPADLLLWFNPDGEQQKNEATKHFEMTAAAQKKFTSFERGSSSSFDTMYVPQNGMRQLSCSSSIFFETSVTALVQASQPYFRLHS